MYTQQLDENDNLAVIVRTSDGANIPTDESNSDYKEYLKWVTEGNTANPDPKTLPPARRAKFLEDLHAKAKAKVESKYPQSTKVDFLAIVLKWVLVFISPTATTAEKTHAQVQITKLASVETWAKKVWDEYYRAKATMDADLTLESVAHDYDQFDIDDPDVKAKDVRD